VVGPIIGEGDEGEGAGFFDVHRKNSTSSLRLESSTLAMVVLHSSKLVFSSRKRLEEARRCRPAGPPALYYSLFRQALCARIGLALCTELDPPSRNLGVVGFSVAWAPVHRQSIRMRHLYWTLLTLWLLRIPTFGQFNPHKVLQDALVLENRGSFETAANFAKAASMR